VEEGKPLVCRAVRSGAEQRRIPDEDWDDRTSTRERRDERPIVRQAKIAADPP
jgi:hypothetical protein